MALGENAYPETPVLTNEPSRMASRCRPLARSTCRRRLRTSCSNPLSRLQACPPDQLAQVLEKFGPEAHVDAVEVLHSWPAR